ncbi:MAG: glycosyltransferase family 2 protein [Cytophagaceae bacterium]|nr:glycosyltransferase family 2 protein [Cytophagaceae bacterium]
MEKLLLVAYTIPLALVFFMSLVQLNLVISYLKYQQRLKQPTEPLLDGALPYVTIQLPIYNELYVAERLLDCIAELRYPRERLEIQVLDDSTDETVALIARKVEELRKMGLTIFHIRRTNRQGYKAGALAEGLKRANGEVVAIFDADFLPKAEFLKRTVPYFQDPSIGMVQSRWEHLNKDYSVLTRIQAFALDGHFIVEQQGRHAGNHFINFNGTAGVWRKTCIEEAGGWQADTLTEDLDLSYRAQLKGWKFKYLENLGSPAELPVEMNALKSQQYRWTKGAAECARKHAVGLFSSPSVRWSDKVHALAHLFYSSTFVCLVVLALLSVPVLFVKSFYPEHREWFSWMSWFQLSGIILAVFYWVAYKNATQNAHFGRFLLDYPVFMVIWMGLSLHNAIAVIEGYLGRKTPFIRTPKFAVIGKAVAGQQAEWQQNKYVSWKIPGMTWIEALFVLYFVGGLYLAWRWNDYSFVLFHLMLTLGYGIVCYFSVLHARNGRFRDEHPQPVIASVPAV